MNNLISLDDCHELEAKLNRREQDRYIDALLNLIVVPAEAEFGVALSDTDTMWVLIHATPTQKHQAYLATKKPQ